jgi:hypothetical protein
MNGYSELLNYFKRTCDQDGFINTVTQGDFVDVDLHKKNIFPLAHISIGNASFPSEGVVRFDCQIGVMDVRDFKKDVVTDKFLKGDNEIDNLNETLTVLNRLWLMFSKDFESQDIFISENPTCEQFTETSKNLLDGWVMTCQIDVPNTTISLCQ